MKSNQKKSISERIKKNKIFSLFALIFGAIVWLSDITEIAIKVTTSVEVFFNNVNNSKLALLEELVNEIHQQSETKKDFSLSYEKLEKLLKANGENVEMLINASRFSDALFAARLEDVILISTVDQYNMNGFVLFWLFDVGCGIRPLSWARI